MPIRSLYPSTEKYKLFSTWTLHYYSINTCNISCISGLQWTVPPDARFDGNNITARANPSAIRRPGSYVDLNVAISLGRLQTIQYYIGEPSPPQVAYFQVWELKEHMRDPNTYEITNASFVLRYEQSFRVATTPGVHEVCILTLSDYHTSVVCLDCTAHMLVYIYCSVGMATVDLV